MNCNAWYEQRSNSIYSIYVRQSGRSTPKCQNTPFIGTDTKMDDSIFLDVRLVTFFSKEHVNWSSIGWVMIGRNWKIKFGKLKIGVTKKIMDFSKLYCSTSSYHNSTQTRPCHSYWTNLHVLYQKMQLLFMGNKMESFIFFLVPIKRVYIDCITFKKITKQICCSSVHTLDLRSY